MSTTRLEFGGSMPAASGPFPAPEAAATPPEAISRMTRANGLRGCILIVDHARAVSEMLSRAIRSFGCEVASALTAREALAVASRVRFDLLLLHGKLRDAAGLELIRALRGQGFDAPFILMTGQATDPVAVEARALGALHVLAEPICLTQLRAAIARALDDAIIARVDRADRFDDGTGTGRPALDDVPPKFESPRARVGDDRPKNGTPPPPSVLLEPHTASERWCKFVIALVTCEYDLKTTAAWARHAGVSRSVIREACRHVHIPPQSARDFARMLGAIRRSGPAWVPESVLDVADRRTLRKFEVLSGFGHGPAPRTPSVGDFLDRQRWIPQDNPALLVLRGLLLKRP
jgi:CheY-like chemotaxis protein